MTFEQAVLFLEKSSSTKKQHTSKKRVVSRHKKVRSDSTDLVVGASITCIQCGANITSPQTESGNECPVCKTINVIFACPECMGYTQSKMMLKV